MKTIRVAVFDDNIFFRESIHIMLDGRNDFEVCGSFENANRVCADVKKSSPDVVLMDIEMPGISGIEAVRVMKRKFPDLPVLMLTDHDADDKVIDSICAGANGYALKTTQSDKIIEAILDVHNGLASLCPPVAKKVMHLFAQRISIPARQNDFALSVREKDVLRLLVKGDSYKMIALALGITYDTVRAHIKNIYKKMHVVSVSGLVAKAVSGHVV